jgi:hypothetical protein
MPRLAYNPSRRQFEKPAPTHTRFDQMVISFTGVRRDDTCPVTDLPAATNEGSNLEDKNSRSIYN